MAEAAIGLLGAVLGAAISAVTLLLLERQRTNVGEQARKVEDQTRVITAARIIYEELLDVSFTVCNAVDTYTWWHHPEHRLPTRRWEEFMPELASPSVPSDVFVWLTTSYQSVRDCNAELDHHFAQFGRLPPFDRQQDRRLRQMLGTVNDGVHGVSELLGEPFNGEIEPDSIAALQMACRNAIISIDGDTEIDWIDVEREPRNVKSGEPLLGVALLQGPDYETFELTADNESELLHFGTCGRYNAFVRDGREERKTDASVPMQIRQNPQFTDLAFISSVGD